MVGALELARRLLAAAQECSQLVAFGLAATAQRAVANGKPKGWASR
jgi:hypothetical protein